MKRLRYQFRITVPDTITTFDKDGNPITETIEREIINTKTVPDTESGRAIAEKEAYGEIESYDDGKANPADSPSQLDIIEAQVTYTAMMTDTLLEV